MVCSLNSFFCSPVAYFKSLRSSEGEGVIKTVFDKIYDVTSIGVYSAAGLVKPADFTAGLKQGSSSQVFKNTKYKELKFDEALLSYRKDVEENLKKGPLKEEYKQIARKIMEQSLLPKACEIMKEYIPSKYSNIPLSKQIQMDRKSIAENAHKAGQGLMNKEGSKLRGEIGVFFDPHLNGNIPFLLGTRTINSSKVKILRHAVPTVETGIAKVSEEYRAFLEDCKSRKKKVLYCSLLSSNKVRELKLIRVLNDLGSEYKDVFHFIRIPLDGSLSKLDDNESLNVYRKKIEFDIWKEIHFPHSLSDGFIFGSEKISEIVLKRYKTISDFAYEHVTAVYEKREQKAQGNPGELKALLKEKKQAFMMLFSTVLRSVLIRKLNISYYGNVCKDAIDRGAAHLITDLVWDRFLNNDLQNNHYNIRIGAAWPAFMAKTQPMIKSRADWAVSFTKWVEGASEMGLHSKISKDYSKRLHLSPRGNFLFNT